MVWAHLLAQQWDVYAPGFRSLRQNEEYVESETEFDMNPKEVEEAVLELDLTCEVRSTELKLAQLHPHIDCCLFGFCC